MQPAALAGYHQSTSSPLHHNLLLKSFSLLPSLWGCLVLSPRVQNHFRITLSKPCHNENLKSFSILPSLWGCLVESPRVQNHFRITLHTITTTLASPSWSTFTPRMGPDASRYVVISSVKIMCLQVLLGQFTGSYAPPRILYSVIGETIQ